MADYTVTKALFQSGEISPFYFGRMDANEYVSGCKLMQNALPDIRGGFKKRPGTAFFDRSSVLFRQVNYKYSGLNYIVQLYFNNVIKLKNVNGTPVDNCPDITVPTTDIPQLVDGDSRFTVHKGVIYIVNKKKPVWTVKIQRSGSSLNILAEKVTFKAAEEGADPSSVMTFEGEGNYPSAVCFKGGRLFLGATENQPNTTWASRTPSGGVDRFNDFTFFDGTPDDPIVSPSHAIEIAETDNEDSNLLWFIVQKRLIAGYEHSIFIENDTWTSPDNFDLDVAINEGSADLPAKAYKSYTLYASPSGHKISLLVWDEDLNGYTSIDITKNAPHLLEMGIKAFDITTSPDPIIWCITKDGGLCSCSIDVSSGFIAWASHPRLSGKYVDLLATGEEEHDRIAFVIQTDDEVYPYSFEVLDLKAESCFTDSSIPSDYASPSKRIKVSPSLEDEEGLVAWTDIGIVHVLNEGASEGGIYYRNIEKAVSHVYCVGLSIKTRIQTLPPALPANGSSMSKVKRIKKVILKFYKSYGGSVVIEDTEQNVLLEKYGEYKYGESIQMVTEDVSLDIISHNTKDGSIEIVHDEPVCFNVLAITATYELMGV